MKHRVAMFLAVLSVSTTDISLAADWADVDKADAGEAKFKIAAKRKDDRVEVRAEKGKVLFDNEYTGSKERR